MASTHHPPPLPTPEPNGIPTPTSSTGSPPPPPPAQPQTPTRPLRRGIYVPAPAFFHSPSEDLDLKTQAWHTIYLAQSGISGIAVHGTNGEAAHLNHDERRQITKTVRTTLDTNGFAAMPLIAGCGAQSVRETVQLCAEAEADGADYAMVLPPCYFRAQVGVREIRAFFETVAERSPVPVLVYNFPAAVGGLDLDSDLLMALAGHRNIVGCKFTCGNVGKMDRVKSAVPEFFCFGGSADFMAGAFSAGADGVVAGVGNVAPLSLCKLWKELEGGDGLRKRHIRELRSVLAHGDWACIKGGVPAVKALLEYGGECRRPLPSLSRDDKESLEAEMQGLRRIEELCAKSQY